MRNRPIIGRDYFPNPTLRQMPRHWQLVESDPEIPPLLSGDAIVGWGCALIGVMLLLSEILGY